MKKFFTHSAKKITALVFLGFFVFTFLHSELGFLNYDNSNHASHDYCQIVKNTNTQSKSLQDNLPKLEINKDICVHCLDDIFPDAPVHYSPSKKEHWAAWQFKEVYLFNRSILI